MEATITAALVAGFVSLIGLLVSLRISKKSNETLLKQLKVGAQIAIAQETVKDIKTYMISIEKLRAEIHIFYKSIRDGFLSKGSLKELHEILVQLETVRVNSEKLFIDWSEVKAHVEEPDLGIIRELRYNCKNRVDNLISFIGRRSLDTNDVENPYLSEEDVRFISGTIEILLKDMEELFRWLNSIRYRKIGEFINV